MRISVITSELAKARAALQGMRPRLRDAHKAEAFISMNRMVNDARRTYRNASGRPTDTATVRRTGNLYRSITQSVSVNNGGVDAEFGVRRGAAEGKVLNYAATQEYGATIRAKSGKALPIPLDAALTARGVARGNPRDFDNTFILRGKKGMLVDSGAIIMQKRGFDVVPLFLLKKQVTIRPRPAIGPAFEKERPVLERNIADATARVLAT